MQPSREDPWVAAASESIGGPVGSRGAPHPWWTPVRVVLAVACLAWMLALVQKAPCAQIGWSGADTRFARLCYSDVPYLYTARGFAERAVPYADSDGRYPDLEYPVGTGYFAYGAAAITQAVNGWPEMAPRQAASVADLGAVPGVNDERQDYFLVTAVLLAPFTLASAWFLARAHRGRPWDAMGFAAAPVLVAGGLVNWDLVAVACLAGALFAWSRDRPLLAGILIGVGTAVKLYPLFLLGALLVVCLRRGELRMFAVAVPGAVAGWVALNLPAMLYGFDGWRGFWTFNADRGADLGSLWLLAQQARGRALDVGTINLVSWVAFTAVCLAVLLLGLTARRVPRVPQLAFLVLVGFLVVNKVYSPQYVLWLLPLAALARPRWRDLLIWQAGELFYFVVVWLHLGSFTAPSTGGPDVVYWLAIVVRVLAELYLAAVVVRDIWRPWADPVRADGVTDDPMHPLATAGPAGASSPVGQDTTVVSNRVVV